MRFSCLIFRLTINNWSQKNTVERVRVFDSVDSTNQVIRIRQGIISAVRIAYIR